MTVWTSQAGSGRKVSKFLPLRKKGAAPGGGGSPRLQEEGRMRDNICRALTFWADTEWKWSERPLIDQTSVCVTAIAAALDTGAIRSRSTAVQAKAAHAIPKIAGVHRKAAIISPRAKFRTSMAWNSPKRRRRPNGPSISIPQKNIQDPEIIASLSSPVSVVFIRLLLSRWSRLFARSPYYPSSRR